MTKDITAEVGEQTVSATVVIEGGKVLNISGRIEGRNEPTEISPSFDAFVYEGNRVMNHHNIPEDDTISVEAFREVVAEVVGRYEE